MLVIYLIIKIKLRSCEMSTLYLKRQTHIGNVIGIVHKTHYDCEILKCMGCQQHQRLELRIVTQISRTFVGQAAIQLTVCPTE